MKKAISKRVSKMKKQISDLTDAQFSELETPKKDNFSEEFKKPLNELMSKDQKKILSDMLDVIDKTDEKLTKALNFKPSS